MVCGTMAVNAGGLGFKIAATDLYSIVQESYALSRLYWGPSQSECCDDALLNQLRGGKQRPARIAARVLARVPA